MYAPITCHNLSEATFSVALAQWQWANGAKICNTIFAGFHNSNDCSICYQLIIIIAKMYSFWSLQATNNRTVSHHSIQLWQNFLDRQYCLSFEYSYFQSMNKFGLFIFENRMMLICFEQTERTAKTHDYILQRHHFRFCFDAIEYATCWPSNLLIYHAFHLRIYISADEWWQRGRHPVTNDFIL